MAQFLKDFGKSKHLANKIKLFMRLTIIAIVIYYYFLICLVLSDSVAPELNFLRTMDARFVIPIVLLFSIIFIILIVYLMVYKKFEKLEKFIYFIYLKMVQYNSFFLYS